MNTLSKTPLPWLVLGSAGAAILSAGVIYVGSTTEPRLTSEPGITARGAVPDGLAHADDSGHVAHALQELSQQIKRLDEENASLSRRVNDTTVELSSVKQLRFDADDDVLDPSLQPMHEEIAEAYAADFTLEQEDALAQMEWQVGEAEALISTEEADLDWSDALNTRVGYVLTQSETSAWLEDTRCGSSICRVAISVDPEKIDESEAVTDLVIDAFDGGGMMVFDEARGEVIYYVARDGEHLPWQKQTPF